MASVPASPPSSFSIVLQSTFLGSGPGGPAAPWMSPAFMLAMCPMWASGLSAKSAAPPVPTPGKAQVSPEVPPSSHCIGPPGSSAQPATLPWSSLPSLARRLPSPLTGLLASYPSTSLSLSQQPWLPGPAGQSQLLHSITKALPLCSPTAHLQFCALAPRGHGHFTGYPT